MEILHPAARDDDNLTTCSAGISSSWRQQNQQNQRSSQKTSSASCENFSDSKTRRDLINYCNSNFSMEEQLKLGLLDSGQHIYPEEGQCNNNKFLCARFPLPGLPHFPQIIPRTTKHCNLGCDTSHHLDNIINTFVSKHSTQLNIINKMNSRRSSLTLSAEDPADTASLLSQVSSQPPSANSPLNKSGSISVNSQLTALCCARLGKMGSSPSNFNDPQEKRRRRSHGSSLANTFFSPNNFVLLVSCLLLVISFSPAAEACSSRSTPKPRPPSPTMRPNITFQTYACPPAYAAWYCLNGATCFTVKIGISILYNCECADGFMGQRCEFKDLDGSYLPTRERLKMALGQVREAATSLPVGLLIIVVLVALAAFAFTKRRTTAKLRRIEAERSDYPEEDDQTSYQTADTSFSEASTQSPEYFWRETESPGRSSATTQTQSNISVGSSRPNTPLQSKQSSDHFQRSSLAMPNNNDNSSMEQIFSLESELSCSKMSRNNSCSSNDDICTVPAALVTSRVHQLTVQPLVVKPDLGNDLSMMAGGDPESPTPSSSMSGSVSFYLPSATSTPTTSITSTTSSSSPCIRESSLTPLSPSTSCSPTSWKSVRSPGSASSSNGGARRQLGSCRSVRSAWMEEEEDCSKAVMASTLSYKLDTSI